MEGLHSSDLWGLRDGTLLLDSLSWSCMCGSLSFQFRARILLSYSLYIELIKQYNLKNLLKKCDINELNGSVCGTEEQSYSAYVPLRLQNYLSFGRIFFNTEIVSKVICEREKNNKLKRKKKTSIHGLF